MKTIFATLIFAVVSFGQTVKPVPVTAEARADYWEAQANQLAAQLKEAQGRAMVCEAQLAAPKLGETLMAKIAALCDDKHQAVMESGALVCRPKPEPVAPSK